MDKIPGPLFNRADGQLKVVLTGHHDHSLVGQLFHDGVQQIQPRAIRELLVKQVTSPVRWTDTVQYLVDNKVDTFIEIGPGSVLAGLIKKFDRSLNVVSVNSPAGIEKALNVLGSDPANNQGGDN